MQLTLLHLATFLRTLLFCLPLTSSTKQSSKPHIIFIVADDLVRIVYNWIYENVVNEK